jgi:hypothetical protein
MANRREIIQAALAAAAVLPCLDTFAAAPANMPLYKVLYDQRSQPALIFATRATRLGALVHATRGDVTDVWFNELQPRWKQHQTAVAGLTDFHSLFVLDMMARDAAMRAVYMAVHRFRGQSAIEHRLFGPRELVRRASPNFAGSDWASEAAGVVTQFPSSYSVAAPHSSIAEARNLELSPGDLVSWVIAPVRKV